MLSQSEVNLKGTVKELSVKVGSWGMYNFIVLLITGPGQ